MNSKKPTYQDMALDLIEYNTRLYDDAEKEEDELKQALLRASANALHIAFSSLCALHRAKK